MPLTSEKTIGRLSLYRHLLQQMVNDGSTSVYSHQLAARAGVTAAQVRRDFMAIGYSGSPTKGYDVRDLMDSIGGFLDDSEGQNVALIGVGNLGRAILSYFGARRPKLNITAAFDIDPNRVNRVIHGCRCYAIEELQTICEQENIRVGIITVPALEAQAVCDKMVQAGIRGILNFAPVAPRVGPDVFVDCIDMATSLEKVAYFSRQGVSERELLK